MVTLRTPALYSNPALREELLSQKPHIIAPRINESLLNWIEATGRFKAYEPVEIPYDDVAAVELDEILGGTVDEPEEEDWDMDD
ncbi:MAG TPA: DUF3134 family protein [Coleofasciculaceae cyanobacterium]